MPGCPGEDTRVPSVVLEEGPKLCQELAGQLREPVGFSMHIERFASLPCAQGPGGENPYVDTKDVFEVGDSNKLDVL